MMVMTKEQMRVLSGELSYRSMMKLSRATIKAFNALINSSAVEGDSAHISQESQAVDFPQTDTSRALSLSELESASQPHTVNISDLFPRSVIDISVVQSIIPQFLFETAALLDDDPHMMSSITDPLRSFEERLKLFNFIGSQVISQIISQLSQQLQFSSLELSGDQKASIFQCKDIVMRAVLELDWNKTRDFINALVEVGVLVAIHATEMSRNRVLFKEDDNKDSSIVTHIIRELTSLQSAIIEHPLLQEKLSDKSIPPSVRLQLWNDIFAQEPLMPVVQMLAQEIVSHLHGRRYMQNISWFINIAAFYSDESLVIVTSAVPLRAHQRRRLQEIWTRHIGYRAQLSELVDPRVMGGLKIQHGDEILDNTVVAQLHNLEQYFSVGAQIKENT